MTACLYAFLPLARSLSPYHSFVLASCHLCLSAFLLCMIFLLNVFLDLSLLLNFSPPYSYCPLIVIMLFPLPYLTPTQLLSSHFSILILLCSSSYLSPWPSSFICTPLNCWIQCQFMVVIWKLSRYCSGRLEFLCGSCVLVVVNLTLISMFGIYEPIWRTVGVFQSHNLRQIRCE